MADYKIEVKVATDLSGVSHQLWANTPLGKASEVYASMKLSDPVNVGTFPYAGVYVPDSLRLEIDNVVEEAPGSQTANGGSFANVTIINHDASFGYADGFFLNIEPRALPGLPFGDIGKFSLRLWLDIGTFSSVDLPTDASFMNGFPSPTTPPRFEWNFLNPGGIGTGFSWAISLIPNARASVQYAP